MTIEKVENNTHLMQFFEFAHLPKHLQVVSQPFGDLANHMFVTLDDGPERSEMLRKLIEAKDCAVRQRILDAQTKGDK